MVRVRPGITAPHQHRSSLIPIPLASLIARLAAYLQENSPLPRRRARFHSQILMVSTVDNHRLLAGHQPLGRSAPVLTMKRLVVGHITHLFRLTVRTRTPFIIARKTWSLRFVCAAMTVAPHTDLQYRPIRRNVADCTGT